MPKIEIMRVSSPKPIEYLEQGDLVLIGDSPFIASQTTMDNLKLISLEDGNRWCDQEIREGSSEDDLLTYINDDENAPIELIKSNKYKIILDIFK